MHTGLPQNLPSSPRCAFHPDREGVGICVNCRTVICVECSTRIEGMNYCIRCLKSAQAPETGDTASRPPGMAARAALLLGAFGAATLAFFLLGVAAANLRH